MTHNPVREGIKKHGSSYAYFLTLKKRADETGMCAIEWDWYRARQKEWEPDVLIAEETAAKRRFALDYARQLSIDDLQAVIAEKLFADTPHGG